MPRVLIVASPGAVAELERTILWRDDVERVFALSRDQGLRAIHVTQPDLVVLGGDGDTLAALRHIRTDPAMRAVSVGVVRSEASAEEEAALRHGGANVVFAGPAVPDLWDQWIEDLLSVPRRREARLPVEFAVWCQAGPEGGATEGTSVNLSTRGMLLQTDEPLEVGARLDLTFRLPGDPERLRTVGQVVRDEVRDRQRRFGVEFLILRETARERIRAFVEAEGRA